MDEDKITSRDSEVLARLRTLMALERNYMAEERTHLAQFRTGITLALMAPSLGSIFFPITFNLSIPVWITVIISLFFTFIMILGISWIVQSHARVKSVQEKKNQVILKEKELLNRYPNSCDFMKDCLDI